MRTFQDDIKALQTMLCCIKKSQQFLSDSSDDLKQQLTYTRESLKRCEKQNIQAEGGASALDSIDSKMNALEQQALDNNLIISNIPQVDGENIVNLITKTVAQFGCNISKPDIVFCGRMTTENRQNIKPILVKFAHYDSKRLVMDVFNKNIVTTTAIGLKPAHRIYANQHLTKKNQRLLNAARDVKSKNAFCNVWFSKGAVYIRRTSGSTPIRIEKVEELSKVFR